MSFVKHTLRAPSSPSKSTISQDSFLGIDNSHSGQGISLSRADGVSYYDGMKRPGLINMVRRSVGTVGKRPGYSYVEKPEQLSLIYNVFEYRSERIKRIFYFTNGSVCVAYEDGTVIKKFSVNFDFENCYAYPAGKYMFFTDCYRMYVYDCENNTYFYFDEQTTSITEPDISYLPTTYIACLPSGSGSAFEPVNRINPFVAEQYIGDGQSKEYTLHFPISSIYKAYIKNQNGEWEETAALKGEKGKAVFETAPPVSSVTGEDNVRIVYRMPDENFSGSDISACWFGTMFGIGGFEDRLFVSGQYANKNYVYYSEMNNPLYFPETNYIKIGTDNNTIIRTLFGLGVNLYVICTDKIYCITGKGVEDNEQTDYVENAVFSITSMLETPSAVGVMPVIFDNEVNYLTTDGICAITATGVVDERCCQIRSSYLNGFLLKENLSECDMLTYKDFIIITNRKNRLYVLDGKQFSASADKPFSQRQYEGYIWEDVPARFMWVAKDILHFSDGADIYRFDNLFEKSEKHFDELVNKDGSILKAPVKAYWETPEIYCAAFSIKKFFTRLGLLVEGVFRENGIPVNTDVRISAKFDNDNWRVVKDYDGKRRIFDYADIDFSRFTYCDRPQSYGIYVRNLHKKGRSIKLRFENDKLNEPLILSGFTIEYLKM